MTCSMDWYVENTTVIACGVARCEVWGEFVWVSCDGDF